MRTFVLWSLASLVAAVYCLAKAVIDIRDGRRLWGVVGLVSAVVFLITPIQTNAVKVDLPVAHP